MSGVISVRGLVKRYGSKTVVDHLDLEVPQGAVYAFLGDNGAGKTSTIKVLVGMHPPDRGHARILGQDCWSKAVGLRHKVGYVPERPRFYEWMTVTEIGWFTAAFHKAGFIDRYHEWTHKLGLDSRKKLRDLSKGGYARVALALALAPDPEVLILDEPTSGLDLLTRRDFLASLVDLASHGRTILISSHGIAELERIASHVGLLSHGKLLFSGPVEDVKRRFTRFQFRALGGEPELAGLGTVLTRQTLGKQVDVLVQDPSADALERLRSQDGLAEIEQATPGLEDIYASVMRNAGAGVGGLPI
ncbi:MAG TPA: ABC transporter ATP-binding protein [Gemmataceae bacterium]|jgi:ABC-2 type transport system ATP-binding protein|nr:ABC transporter ATP-binding protein [Gemmataceae bacterium]